MKETTQQQLLELAAKHPNNELLQSVVNSITHAKLAAQSALTSLTAATAIATSCVEFKDGYRVRYDNSDLVQTSAKAAQAMSAMNHLFVTLSIHLAALGETVLY